MNEVPCVPAAVLSLSWCSCHLSRFSLSQGHLEGARPAGKSLNLPDGKEMGQSEEEIQGSLLTHVTIAQPRIKIYRHKEL